MWGAIAGLVGSALNFFGQRSANQQNERLSKEQQAAQMAHDKEITNLNYQNNSALQAQNIGWQREQLQNQTQWSTADLRKAGLNPLLAATQGHSNSAAGAAQSTSGSAGALSRAEVQNPYSGAVSSALQALQLSGNLKAIESQSLLNQSTAEKNQAEARDLNAKTNSGYWALQGQLTGANTEQSRAMLPLIKQQVVQAKQSVRESNARIQSIQNEIKLLKARIESEKAGQSRDLAQAELNRKLGELSEHQAAREDSQAILNDAYRAAQEGGWLARNIGTAGSSEVVNLITSPTLPNWMRGTLFMNRR